MSNTQLLINQLQDVSTKGLCQLLTSGDMLCAQCVRAAHVLVMSCFACAGPNVLRKSTGTLVLPSRSSAHREKLKHLLTHLEATARLEATVHLEDSVPGTTTRGGIYKHRTLRAEPSRAPHLTATAKVLFPRIACNPTRQHLVSGLQ